MKTITINVTQEDIDEGFPKSCSLCPIARAVHRFVDGRSRVGMGHIHIGPFPAKYRVALPASALVFISEFDRGLPVSPISFELQVPDEVVL